MTDPTTRQKAVTQGLTENEQHLLARMQDETTKLVGIVENLHVGDQATLDDIKYHLHVLQTEQDALKAYLLRQRRQLAFYGSFDKLLYDTLQQPVSHAIETVRTIVEQAETHAAATVDEAQRERQLILEEARLQARKIAGDGVGLPAAMVGDEAPAMFPATTLHHQNERQSELVVSGLKTFSQAVEFQRTLLAIPEINQAKVRLIQRGLVNLEIRHEPGIDLGARIANLPGFALRMVKQEPGLLALDVERRSSAVDGLSS